jgi:hypothetical protein
MIRYMLDTNACIGVINNRPAILRDRLVQVAPPEVAISQIVHYELAFGVCNSSQPEKNQAGPPGSTVDVCFRPGGNDHLPRPGAAGLAS